VATVNTLVQLFDGNGNLIDESFFSGFNSPSAKQWANDNKAVMVKTHNVEIEKTAYYIKAGANARWSEASPKMFEFISQRNKDQ